MMKDLYVSILFGLVCLLLFTFVKIQANLAHPIRFRPLIKIPHLAVKISNDTFVDDTQVKRSQGLVSTITAASTAMTEQLSFMQTMTAGAVSRTMAQTLLHPAHTYKTILQLRDSELKGTAAKLTLERLLRGVDAQFLLSLPHGAFHFFVIDQVKQVLGKYMSPRLNFLADFTSSAISTVICSVISTPQMVITDRLMAGVYPSFPAALDSILKADGISGFYRGWWPALAQKIPSYGLTWMFFQQLKRVYENTLHQKPSNEENFLLGALAAAGSVIVMIPMDTIKTRLVIQTGSSAISHTAYKGVTDCFLRICREEGIGSFYRSLPPRLLSVVPMIAIQFGVYEGLKTQFVQHNIRKRLATANRTLRSSAALVRNAGARKHANSFVSNSNSE